MWDFGYYILFPTCGNEGNQCEITNYYYVDAKQLVLEIRTIFCCCLFFMVVANCGVSCYWLHIQCSQYIVDLQYIDTKKVAFTQNN